MPTQSTGDLKATLSIPSSAKIFINGTTTDPTETFKDYYSKGQIYSVTAADGKTTANYKINVTNKPISPPSKDFFPYSHNSNPQQPITANNTLRVINNCSYPLWIHTEGRINGGFLQNDVKLEHSNALDYMIPSSGARASLTKAYAGCDDSGKNCSIGSNDVDTRFEVDWFSTTTGSIVPNLSVVEGYTLPIKVDYKQANIQKTQDCGKLSLKECPSDFIDYKGSGPFDERIFSGDTIVGCYPNKKINPNDKNYNKFKDNEDGQYYGCPTPPVDVPTCRKNYGADPKDSTIISDATPTFVKYLHNYGDKYKNNLDATCRIYAYAYDDTWGTPHSDANKPITLTYCPNPAYEPKLPSH